MKTFKGIIVAVVILLIITSLSYNGKPSGEKQNIHTPSGCSYQIKGIFVNSDSVEFPFEIKIDSADRWCRSLFFHNDSEHILGSLMQWSFDGKNGWKIGPEGVSQYSGNDFLIDKATWNFYKQCCNSSKSGIYSTINKTRNGKQYKVYTDSSGINYWMDTVTDQLCFIDCGIEDEKDYKCSYFSGYRDFNGILVPKTIIHKGTTSFKIKIFEISLLDKLEINFFNRRFQVFSSEQTESLVKKREYWPTETWISKSPEEMNINPAYLAKADEYFSRHLPFIRSLLLVKDGYLVHERYYNGTKKSDLQHTCSVTKSITSTLLGIAISEGLLSNVDEPVGTFYPGCQSCKKVNKDETITLKHLLSMSAGFKWTEQGPSDWPLDKKTDWFKKCTDLEIQENPGQRFNYNSGLSHLVSGVISKVTNKPALDYARKKLFSEMGIKQIKWETDNFGNNIGGYGLWMLPCDMAKFGYLFLNHGRWNDKQIVPATWVSEATLPQMVTGFELDPFYGYQWWIKNIGGINTFYAYGYGGQHIMVIPSLDMVVVTTCNEKIPSQMAGYSHLLFLKFIENVIIPSVKVS